MNRALACQFDVREGLNAANPMSGTRLQYAWSPRPEEPVEVEQPRGRNLIRWRGVLGPTDGGFGQHLGVDGRGRRASRLIERRTEEGSIAVNPRQGRELEPSS